MTIVEAIKVVLRDSKNGLTSREVYEEIISRKLYNFGAKEPINVVNGAIRRRCYGLDFPTAFPVKYFKINNNQGNKPVFCLANKVNDIVVNGNEVLKNIELLPEEKIDISYKEHIESVRLQTMDFIKNNTPTFFEQLVMDLLIKMGYGNSAGVVTGRSHDGGIDGIIYEDKLGLDLIYIQAKRYNDKNRVGRKEIQAFIGAMENVNKGVFITTSNFTTDAIKFSERQQKNIKLIDGTMIADLIVKYEIGISAVKTYTILKLDSDYYNS